jgi:hypothetical protein
LSIVLGTVEINANAKTDGISLPFPKETAAMAVNKPIRDTARVGAVRKRSQLKTAIEGEEHWTKRSKETGEFMDQKKDPEAKPFKGLLRERTNESE